MISVGWIHVGVAWVNMRVGVFPIAISTLLKFEVSI